MRQHAQPDHPIHELMVRRWSPYGFAEREVSKADLRSILEAARWAASSYNEQPWGLIVATRDAPEAFQRLVDCLVPGNQEWAGRAGALLLTTIRRTFTHNGKPNRCAEHDLGLAMGNLSLEATARGLHVHQMAGLDLDKARESYHIPKGIDPWTVVAVGYAAEAEDASVPENLRQRDRNARSRKPLEEFVFGDRFGEAAEL
jgi:nitroreductase